MIKKQWILQLAVQIKYVETSLSNIQESSNK